MFPATTTPANGFQLQLTSVAYLRFKALIEKKCILDTSGNKDSFPAFSYPVSLSQGKAKLIVRGSPSNPMQLGNKIRKALRDEFESSESCALEERIRKTLQIQDFTSGKISAGLFTDEITDPNAGNLAILEGIFPKNELSNKYFGGVSILPTPDIEQLIFRAEIILTNIYEVLGMDGVTRLREIYARLESHKTTNHEHDPHETLVSDIADNPILDNEVALARANVEFIIALAQTPQYQVLEKFIAKKCDDYS